MYLYDIKHEYEIYSGNFTNLTKGDGLYRKVILLYIIIRLKLTLIIFKRESFVL